MKKTTLILSMFAALVIAGTGCVKDKGFDRNEYGINDPDASPAGVGFLQGVKFLNSVGLNLSGDAQSIVNPLTISVLSAALPTSDVHVQIAGDTGIVGQYNRDNSATPGFTPLEIIDPSLFNFSAQDIVIPAGKKTAEVVLNVPSALSFDANLKYGIGVKIVSTDPAYRIASNEDEVLLQITIKNIYDGRYELHGQFYHPTAAPGFPTFTVEVELWTTGPNSVEMYSPDYDDFLHPWTATTDGSLTAFGSQSPEYTIDPSDNSVTVQNIYPGAVTFYAMGIGFDNNGYNSRWDPATSTLYANFGYNLGAGGAFNPAASREWIDTLVYIGPR